MGDGTVIETATGKGGCTRHKSESKRLRFVLIIICSTDFFHYWRTVQPSFVGAKPGQNISFKSSLRIV